MVEHLFHGADGLGLAGMPLLCRTPGGLFTSYSPPLVVYKEALGWEISNNPPITLLGDGAGGLLQLENTKASEPRSAMLLIPLNVVKAFDGRYGRPFLYMAHPAVPGHLLKDFPGPGEVFQGGELFPNMFPPCFVPGQRSEAGWDMWCYDAASVPGSVLPFQSAPA